MTTIPAVMICLLGLGSPDRELSADRAAVRLEKIIRAVGISEPIKFDRAQVIDSQRWGFKAPKVYLVVYTMANKRFVQAMMLPDGRLLQFQVIPYPEGQSGQGAKGIMSTIEVVRRADSLVSRFGAQGTYVRNSEFGVGQGQLVNVTYRCLLHGLPFFNLNPTYGYRVSFNRVTGAVIDYFAPPDFPPVNADKAKVSSAQAVKLLEHWAKTHYRSGGGAAYLYGPDWKVKIELRPELGYYKFAKEPKARLAWYAHMWVKFNGSSQASDSGYLRMLVDAQTAEMKLVDDAGMN